MLRLAHTIHVRLPACPATALTDARQFTKAVREHGPVRNSNE